MYNFYHSVVGFIFRERKTKNKKHTVARGGQTALGHKFWWMENAIANCKNKIDFVNEMHAAQFYTVGNWLLELSQMHVR